MRTKQKLRWIGAENVGGTTAQRLARRSWDVVYCWRLSGRCKRNGPGFSRVGPVYGYDGQIIGTDAAMKKFATRTS
jgi:hypothetical protein